MARQLPPEFLGVLKTDEKAADGFIRTVWRLPSGHTRLIAMRATEVAKSSKDGSRLTQEKLVDIYGNIV